jgi:hypothetical protein
MRVPAAHVARACVCAIPCAQPILRAAALPMISKEAFMISSKLALVILLMLLPVSALAADSATMYGPRVGVSFSPNQLVVGGQIEFPEFAPNLNVAPNLELGFFDNQTTISMNGDFLYHFHTAQSPWTPYAGMGIGINVTQFDGSNGTGSETNVGANLIGGASVPTKAGNRFFGELRVGLGDIPNLKLIAGWNFKM